MHLENSLQHIFNRSRGCGSTQAIIDGLKSYTGVRRPLILTHSEPAACSIRSRLLEACVSADVRSMETEPSRFMGQDFGPVMLDLPVALALVEECQRRGAALDLRDKEIYRLQQSLLQANKEIETLHIFLDEEVLPRYVEMFDAAGLGDPSGSVVVQTAKNLLGK